VTKDLEQPKAIGGKPVVVVAVENDRGVIVDSGIAKQLFQLGFRDDVAYERVAELRRPVPPYRSRDMSLVVGGRIDVDLGDSDRRILQVLACPIGADEDVGGLTLSAHNCSPF
jgi:hypothetical protein